MSSHHEHLSADQLHAKRVETGHEVASHLQRDEHGRFLPAGGEKAAESGGKAEKFVAKGKEESASAGSSSGGEHVHHTAQQLHQIRHENAEKEARDERGRFTKSS